MNFPKLLALLLLIFMSNQVFAKKALRYNESEVTFRKSLDEAYQRFGKIYDPFRAENSNLNRVEATQLQILLSMTDMAVIEKVVLLEFIGKIHEGELDRDTPHKDYYDEILSELEGFEVTDRIKTIKEGVIKGIKFHREVLDAWLEAARKNNVKSVMDKNGRWVHPGTSAGDKIFYNLYTSYIKKVFKEENPESLEAISRHLCVLVF